MVDSRAALEELAAFAAGLTYEMLPEAVAKRAALLLLDTVGAILGGARTSELRALAGRLDGPGPATLLGGGRQVGCREAALWNATAGCALELYEGSRFTRAPTAIQFLPAAVAEAERAGAPGSELLVALVAGYEVGSRVARAWHLKDLHHPSGTWGVMAAAAAVAKLRGLPSRALLGAIETAAALCLTTSMETVKEGATVRNAYAGAGNMLGSLACDLETAGLTPLPGAVERIYAALLCDRHTDGILDRPFGVPFEIERGYFKQHACYRHAHAALDALDVVLAREHPRVEDIAAIRVRTYAFAAGLANPAPRSTLAAQFSIPHALAAFCVLGHAGPGAFAESTLDDPRIGSLRSRVAVTEDPAHTAMEPERRPATVEIALASGQVFSATVDLPKGEPENPLAPAEIEAKFLGLAAGPLGAPTAETLRDRLLALARLPDVRPVFSAATGAVRPGSAPAS